LHNDKRVDYLIKILIYTYYHVEPLISDVLKAWSV